jgi:hypothetical protein
MKRQILHALGVGAFATGGLLATAAVAHAESGSSNGNQVVYIYQHDTVVCGNAVAVESVVQNRCDGSAGSSSAGTHDVDLDSIDGFLDLDLDFSGDTVDDEAGRWFHIDSRTGS